MKIIQLTNTTAYQMMGYVICTDQNKIIVIDGGYVHQSDELYRVLCHVGKHVDLWILTHIHEDHFGSIKELFSIHSDITVDEFWRNPITESIPYLTEAEIAAYRRWIAFETAASFSLYNPTVGTQKSFGDVTVEVLGTANPELTTNVLNNQSMAFRVKEAGFSMIFLGDLGIEGGKKLLSAYGKKLQSDAVQMAHHGQAGVTYEVYAAICPTYAFWPTPLWLWRNEEYLGGTPGKGNFQTPEVIGWMKNLKAQNITSFSHTVLFDTKLKKQFIFSSSKELNIHEL